ncbi:MAG: histidine phosphatase family protein [Clostridia bacterium]|nr:histidine phosphatase family protein [Clostridia bacterium]
MCEHYSSKKGKSEAEALVNSFENIALDVAYSSPYKRAFETIEPLCKTRGLKIESDEAFKERVLSSEHVENFNTTLEKLWLENDYKL